jgi:hypothetical protein
MSYDKSATLSEQVIWLRQIGFQQIGTFFQWGRFGVFAGWKGKKEENQRLLKVEG